MPIQHKSFKHLRQLERERIEELLQENNTHRKIASIIGRNLSTIIREIKRNSRSDGSYTAAYAQKKTIERRQAAKAASRKIENNSKLRETVVELLTGDDQLRGDWSPEVIANTGEKGTGTIILKFLCCNLWSIKLPQRNGG